MTKRNLRSSSDSKLSKSKQTTKAARRSVRCGTQIGNLSSGATVSSTIRSTKSNTGDSSDFVLGVANESGSMDDVVIPLVFPSSGGCTSVASVASIQSNSDWIPCAVVEESADERISDSAFGFRKIADIDGPPIRSSKKTCDTNRKPSSSVQLSSLTHEFDAINVYNGYYTSDDGETYHSTQPSKRKPTKKPQRADKDKYAPKLLTQNMVSSESSPADSTLGPIQAFEPSNFASLSDIERQLPTIPVTEPESSDSWDGAVEEGKCGSSDEEKSEKVHLKNKKKVKKVLTY
jgi:hypothetical protein